MNCQLFHHHIDDYLDNILDVSGMQGVERHAEACSRCSALLEQERRLRLEMRELPVAPSSPDFAARVLHQAKASSQVPQRHRLVAAALAASLMLGIAIGQLGSKAPEGQLAQVHLQVNEPRALSLAFNSPRDFKGATFVMALPAGVELVNHPGQRELIWQADLKAGRNLLTLPLVARHEDGGEVLAEIRHGNEIKRFVLQVEAGQTDRHTSAAPVTLT